MDPELQIIRVPLTDEKIAERFGSSDDEALFFSPLNIQSPAVVQTCVPVVQTCVPVIQNVRPAVITIKPPRRLEQIAEQLHRHIGSSRIAFTCLDRLDGVGAQAMSKISARVMAEALKQDYAHAPFDRLEHCDETMKLSEYCQRWENILQISGGSYKHTHYPHIHNLCHSDSVIELTSQAFKVGHLYCFTDCHSFTNTFRDQLRDPWKKVITGLRTRYYGVNSVQATQSDTIQVAVHVRRGDVKKNSTITSYRWLDNEYYLNIMKKLESEYRSIVFDVVSEGVAGDFEDITSQFAPEKIRLHLSVPSSNTRLKKISQPQRCLLPIGGSRNQVFLNRRRPVSLPAKPVATSSSSSTSSVFDAFQVLVAADILIMSRGAFSFLAAIYSKGRKIYPSEMLIAVPKWCEENDYWFDNVAKLF